MFDNITIICDNKSIPMRRANGQKNRIFKMKLHNDNLQHLLTMLEHYESQALNIEIGLRHIRTYLETFAETKKEELENE